MQAKFAHGSKGPREEGDKIQIYVETKIVHYLSRRHSTNLYSVRTLIRFSPLNIQVVHDYVILLIILYQYNEIGFHYKKQHYMYFYMKPYVDIFTSFLLRASESYGNRMFYQKTVKSKIAYRNTVHGISFRIFCERQLTKDCE